jgi:outer membrane protein assembly factor BamE (lipoprotein component of BamABCDE complex)
MKMKNFSGRLAAWVGIAVLAVSIAGCDRNLLSGSKLTLENYNKVSTGMSKAQVEKILGPPTKSETKDMIIFKKTTYRYEDGKNFAMVTFKNDEVDGKDTNLTSTP